MLVVVHTATAVQILVIMWLVLFFLSNLVYCSLEAWLLRVESHIFKNCHHNCGHGWGRMLSTLDVHALKDTMSMSTQFGLAIFYVHPLISVAILKPVLKIIVKDLKVPQHVCLLSDLRTHVHCKWQKRAHQACTATRMTARSWRATSQWKIPELMAKISHWRWAYISAFMATKTARKLRATGSESATRLRWFPWMYCQWLTGETILYIGRYVGLAIQNGESQYKLLAVVKSGSKPPHQSRSPGLLYFL